MISHLSIQGFRGIARELQLEFARVTLLTGRNGLGKTTVFDAIDWCLFGSAWRLGAEGAIRNLYCPDIRPRVCLILKLDREYVLERDESGGRIDGEPVSDKQLVLQFVRDPEVFGPYARDVDAKVRRLVYLPQAEIRDLIKPAAESERVAILHSLLGVPNASVVEKGVRRVRERIGDKEVDILARLESMHSDIAQTRALASPIYEHGGLDRESEIRLAKESLGSEAAGSDSVEGLLALAKASLNRARRRRSQLVELRAWLAETSQRRRALEASITAAGEEIVNHELALAEQEVAVRRAVEERETARETLSIAGERLGRVMEGLENARRLEARLRVLEEAQAAAAAIGEEIVTIEEVVRARREEVVAEEESLEVLRTQQARARERLGAWHAEDARMRERIELEHEADSVRMELEGVRRQKAALNAKLQTLESELLALNQVRREAEARYRGLLARAPAAGRLASLINEVALILPEASLAVCPLCGAEYQGTNELLRHVLETANRRQRDIETLEVAFGEIKLREERVQRQEAEHLSTRETLSEITRHEEDLARRLRQLGARLVELGRTEDVREHQKAGDEIRTTISQSQRQIEERARRLNSLRSDVEKQELKLAQLRGELAVRRARVDDVGNEFGEQRVEVIRNVVGERMGELGLEHTAGAAEATAAEERERRAAAAVGQADARRTQLGRELADARGRQAGDVERLRGLKADVASRVREIGVDEATENIEPLLLRLMEELEAQEEKLRRVTIAMESLAGLREQEDRRARLAALETRGSEIKLELDRLLAAKSRFEVIATAVRERAEKEAREALAHQTAAIQQSLTALLPHRHLDRLVWDETTGAILVTDRLLTSAVRPDLYTSTGQMNVLALAVFLGVALLQRITTLGFLAFDEPVQNLDDVHFLAFITLMKRVAGSRQVILSTADRNVAELIRRQMKSSWEAREYVQYEYRGFEADSGPDVVKVESRSGRG